MVSRTSMIMRQLSTNQFTLVSHWNRT